MFGYTLHQLKGGIWTNEQSDEEIGTRLQVVSDDDARKMLQNLVRENGGM